ncbi:MAG: hypothetical protein JXR76_11575 [Deltaproteobacteria bacterium]|nr:hypothetical protein [Deltaproteobacteria bacterium]
MTGDKKKENRWARVLDDAGLLDEVEDAWELPEGGRLNDGATLEVRTSVPSGPTVPVIESKSEQRVSRDDETQKVITVISADPTSGSEEDTVRVSYADGGRKRDLTGRRPERGSLPLSPVTPDAMVAESEKKDPAPHSDTDPGQFAYHTRNSWDQYHDAKQPEYASTINEDDGWATLMDDDRDTREVPTFSERPATNLVSTADDEIDLEFDISSPLEPGEQSALSSEFNNGRERFERGSAPRVSIPDLHGNLDEPAEDGMIMDVPMASMIPEPIELTPPSMHIQMAEKYDMNDFSGALAIAEKILETSPDDIDAFQYKKSCRDWLLQMYESRIGDMENIPSLIVSTHELMWRNLDAAAGFVLSRIDGVSSYSDILDISGMPKFETCRILFQLLEDGLIK